MSCLHRKIISKLRKWVFTRVHGSPLESGVHGDYVPPYELFTNAVAGRGRPARALFHISARNVINISSGNICHIPLTPPYHHHHHPTLSHTWMPGQTQTFFGDYLLPIHLQRGIKWCSCGIMSVFMPCSTQRFHIWARLECFDPWKDSYQAIWRRRKVTQ